MKKSVRLLVFLLLFSLLFSFSACKKDNEEEKKGFVWDAYNYENLGEFITLPDYKHYTVSQAFIDREINLILSSLFDDQRLYVDVTAPREVREWDNVKIEFITISVDGQEIYPVVDDPGTEANESEVDNTYTFTIGTGFAISNINDAVIGMTLNSEKEITFTFPADYKNVPAYAGKSATFKFKLTAHKEPPELTDDLCYRYTTYINPEVMRKMFEQEIIYSQFWKKLYADTVLVKAPEKEYNDYYNAFVEPFKTYAKSNNKTLEEYVTTEGHNHPSAGLYQGISMDEFYKIARDYANDNIKNDLILHALVRAEGLLTSGPLFEAAQKELLLSYGIGYTIDSLIEQFGETQIATSIMDIQVRKQVLKYVTKTT